MWIIVSLLAIIGLNASLGQVVTPPAPEITALLGETVVLSCYTPSVVQDAFSFEEYITSPAGNVIYSTPPGPGISDETKYEIQGTYDLHIKDVQIVDGGLYSCQTVAESTDYKSNVVVLDEPAILLPDLLEEQQVPVSCSGRYGGPPPDDIAASNTPNLRMMIGSEVHSGAPVLTPGNPGPGSEYKPSELKYTFNYTPSAVHDGLNVTCELYTNSPSRTSVSAMELSVRYAVRGITLAPINEFYYVGEYINCTASGNPNPTYKWVPIQSAGSAVYSVSQLQIMPNMVGYNEWECQATNTAQGVEAIETRITFDVYEALPPTSTASIAKATTLSWLLSITAILWLSSDLVKVKA